MAPKTAVDIPCEVVAMGADDDVGEGAETDDATDEIGRDEPPDAYEEAGEVELDSNGEEVAGGLVSVGDDDGGVAVVGVGELVGGGVSPPYVQTPSVPNGI